MLKFIIFIFFLIFFSACEGDKTHQKPSEKQTYTPKYYQATGYAQGTTYNVIYEDKKGRNLSFSIDSILKDFDQQLSIYVDSSTISQVNKLRIGDSLLVTNKPLFITCFRLAKSVYQRTNHSFNPALYPLVKYWGFLNFEQADIEHQQHEIDSLLALTDFSDNALKLITHKDKKFVKKYKFCKIDFNAIAQGFSVDVIANYLDNLGLKNYMVEVGGELKTKGVNNQNKAWRIGIDKPVEHSKPGEQDFQIIVQINNLALATSGNYRKFYKKNGVKYAHTINPTTGKPVQHHLLSTTVVTKDCGLADAYATAFMVMGVEKTKNFLQENKDLDLAVYLIFSDSTANWQTWQTSTFDKLIKK